MKSIKLFFVILFLLPFAINAQTIDPSQILWPNTTGFGPPVSPFVCSASNFGESYTDLTNSNYYVCMNPSSTPTYVLISSGGSAVWGSITGTINSQTDLQTEFATKQPLLGYTPAHSGSNSDITALLGLTTPLAVSEGGTGTSTPHLVAGTNVTITGTWPNQTINSSSSGNCPNAITFNSGGAGAASPTTFNCTAARTISYNTLGASPLAGSSSLTIVGTISTGIWHGTVIAPLYGGTGGAGTGYMHGNGTSPVTYQASIPWTSMVGGGTAGGDLTGTYPNPTVNAINGLNVPDNATVLASNGSGQLINQTGTISNNTSGLSAGLSGALTNCGASSGMIQPAYGIASNGNSLCHGDIQFVANNAACEINDEGSYTSCPVTINWPHAFVDTNYAAVCMGINPTSTGGEWQATVSGYQNKTTSSIQVIVTTQGTSQPQGYTNLDCIGIHN